MSTRYWPVILPTFHHTTQEANMSRKWFFVTKEEEGDMVWETHFSFWRQKATKVETPTLQWAPAFLLSQGHVEGAESFNRNFTDLEKLSAALYPSIRETSNVNLECETVRGRLIETVAYPRRTFETCRHSRKMWENIVLFCESCKFKIRTACGSECTLGFSTKYFSIVCKRRNLCTKLKNQRIRFLTRELCHPCKLISCWLLRCFSYQCRGVRRRSSFLCKHKPASAASDSLCSDSLDCRDYIWCATCLI